MMTVDHLEDAGRDSFGRPVWRHAGTGYWYCTTDPEASLDDVHNGKAALFRKDGGPDGEPAFPVRILINEPPSPEGYIVIQDGIFGEWTAVRDNDLGEIIGQGFETRAEAVAVAQKDKEVGSWAG